MKKIKLTDLSDTEIMTEIDAAKEEIRKSRFQFAVSRSLENPNAINNAKKKIARLFTIKRERELGINSKK